MNELPTIYVVDDDEEIRRSLSVVLETAGFSAEFFATAEEFLDQFRDTLDTPKCLLLDVRLPGVSGLGLQQHLSDAGTELPIIGMTGYSDVSMVVQAMRAGAVDFLEKPINPQLLLQRIQQALDQDAQNRSRQKRQAKLNVRLESLSSREREVMDLLVTGKNTKQISATLEIGLQTVAKHRAAVLEKIDVDSVVELVRLVSM